MDIGKIMRNHTKSILFIVVILSFAGLFAAFKLPVALFPNIAFPRIVVSADAGDMPADRMMITVTRKLEEAVNSIPDVLTVRSTTSRGATELSINFHWNIDMIKAELLVNNAITQVRSDLPARFQFRVRRMNPTIFPIIGYSLISKSRSLVDLRNFAEYVLRPVLTSIDGVANVVVLGGRTKEYQVIVNPERLRSFDLSMSDLIDAIRNTNIISSVGKIEQDYQLYLTLVDGQYSDVKQVGHTVVKIHDHMPVFLDDVAVIRESSRPEWTRVTSNGREAVLLNVYQQPGGNTVKIDTEIKKTLASMQDRIPGDISVSKFYDQSDLIVESMKNVRDSIVVGIFLAVIILFAFLRNWKITLIASLDVPLTIAITILAMNALKMSFNIMTLGGMAAAIGLIIDDAIVVVENIIRHLALRRQTPNEAVHSSLKEILHPILGSSFSTIVVFAPLAFLTGVTGAFFKSLSLTMAISLLVSMLLSMFFIPILSHRFISRKDAEKQEKPGQLFALLHKFYETTMAFLFKRKYLTFIFAGILLISSYFLYKGLPSGFLPRMDEGTFILDYRTPPGTSLQETNRVMMQIEKVLTTIPEIVSYSRRTGLQLGGGLTEANSGDFLVRLAHKRSRNIQQITDATRTKVLKNVPGVEIEFAQLMGDLIGDLTAVPQPIEIKIFGNDYNQIHQMSRKVVNEIQKIRGVVDIYKGVTIAGSSIIIKVDNLRAGLFGLTADDVRREVNAAIKGTVASEIQDQQYMSGIRVWSPLNVRRDLDRIKHLRIYSPKGDYISLGSVADLQVQTGQPELTRENLKQMIAVKARISGRDMGSTLREIQSKIKQDISLPQNVFIKYGGLYREQQKSFKGLLIVLIMAVLLVFSVQLLEFESFKIPAIILAIDFLSLFGVFLLLRLTGVALNISSMMGMIMIIGIVAENAIFLIHYIQLFRKEGVSINEAIIKAGKVRMRPIIMTTLAAVLALMPLAIGIGAGAQMQQPLAISVIGGFSLSAFLLLFVLPVFYAALFRDEKRNTN
ncbi:MAG TPA: efflux RND transporter permease subunit [Bacteroidetes bacterium]|nr:efflux RND transporter permease subunit [Bacteroidota bacterium]